jgi:hypothetical protein
VYCSWGFSQSTFGSSVDENSLDPNRVREEWCTEANPAEPLMMPRQANARKYLFIVCFQKVSFSGSTVLSVALAFCESRGFDRFDRFDDRCDACRWPALWSSMRSGRLAQ